MASPECTAAVVNAIQACGAVEFASIVGGSGIAMGGGKAKPSVPARPGGHFYAGPFYLYNCKDGACEPTFCADPVTGVPSLAGCAKEIWGEGRRQVNDEAPPYTGELVDMTKGAKSVPAAIEMTNHPPQYRSGLFRGKPRRWLYEVKEGLVDESGRWQAPTEIPDEYRWLHEDVERYQAEMGKKEVLPITVMVKGQNQAWQPGDTDEGDEPGVFLESAQIKAAKQVKAEPLMTEFDWAEVAIPGTKEKLKLEGYWKVDSKGNWYDADDNPIEKPHFEVMKEAMTAILQGQMSPITQAVDAVISKPKSTSKASTKKAAGKAKAETVNMVEVEEAGFPQDILG